MSEAVWISVIGLFSGGIGVGLLEILKHYVKRSDRKVEADQELRQELRLELDRKIAEIDALKQEMRKLEDAADKWRLDYWALFEIFFQIKMLSLQVAQTNPTLREQLEQITAPHEQKMRDIDESTGRAD